MDRRIPYRLNAHYPRQGVAEATHSPIQARLSLESIQETGPQQVLDITFPEVDCIVLLLRAKVQLETGPVELEKYLGAQALAWKALRLCLDYRNLDYASRCYFYLAETHVIHAKESLYHLTKALEFYNRALECSNPAFPEAKRAEGRLAELKQLFPQSAVTSAVSSSGPWSHLFERNASFSDSKSPSDLKQRSQMMNSPDELMHRMTEAATRRSYERIPSFSTIRSDESQTWNEEHDSAAESGNQADSSNAGTTESPMTMEDSNSPGVQFDTDVSPRSTYPPIMPTPPHLTQAKLRTKSVTFSPDLGVRDRRPSLNLINHRRSLSRSLTLPHRSRSATAQMEEGRSPVSPEFNMLWEAK